MAKPDLTVDDRGSMFLLTPISELAKEWVQTNLALEGWQWLGASFAVEHRFVGQLVDGMRADGLRVA
jgi:hypothetical protein